MLPGLIGPPPQVGYNSSHISRIDSTFLAVALLYGESTSMFNDLFMLWMVSSITVAVVSMVLCGLLCLWCAFRAK